MKDILLDSALDTIKLLPFLFITFLVLEFVEHKLNSKNQKLLVKSQKVGPLFGGVLGVVPQCGFSSMAANLYSARIITLGTLIAVFLSTSDEMLPIMIGEKASALIILKIILGKVLIAIFIGFLIDIIYHKKNNHKHEISEICEHDHCDCEHEGILLSSIKHAIKISFFILIANLLINIIIFKVGDNNLANTLVHNNLLTYFMASLIGLIPNCAGSVIITKLYLSGLIKVGMMFSGLLTGSGLGILLLYKTNKNMKENIIITLLIYLIGVIMGMLIDLII